MLMEMSMGKTFDNALERKIIKIQKIWKGFMIRKRLRKIKEMLE